MTYEAGEIWVVKVGSSLLTNHGQGLDLDLVQTWVDDISRLRAGGISVVLVSSGAVAEGMKRLGLASRPHSIHELQAAAAVGQMGLIQMYESAFQRHDIKTAQILLTHDDLRSRERYLNARSTLNQLLSLDVVPIVNENDTVVTDEIQFGDNDTLAALVSNLIGADTLVLLTDQAGLMTADPRKDPGATLVARSSANDGHLDALAGGSSALGRGGMLTKVKAARVAARSGADTVIVSGKNPGVLIRLAEGTVDGTLLTADRESMVARKQWLASLPVRGKLTLDTGACRVLRQEGRSLLAVGILASTGNYHRGDMVVCQTEDGHEVARGLVNYAGDEVSKLCGEPSDRIESLLGFVAEPEVIHRDNLVLV